MPVSKQYRGEVELPVPWDWQLVHDMEDLLSNRGFSMHTLSWLGDDAEGNARSSRELAAEFPDPTQYNMFHMYMKAEDDDLNVGLYSEGGIGSFKATVKGSNQEHVLGLTELLRRFVDAWEPREDKRVLVQGDSDPIEKMPTVVVEPSETRWYLNPWVYTVGGGLVVALVVYLISSL